ncbi:MAG: 2-C-methyl-D-erythritol 4-phosphate cytidylyltransferase [Treponema sp.]|jgi:2-C-methyl-D-erythritol 4-phosphate cytidylyltransferase|nr:2-C-methyl-D-erythritol 4-phosphate cytidylyltransferase [Treponema sp.]
MNVAAAETVWAAVITAAGSSSRMKGEAGNAGGGKKEYRPLDRADETGKPLTVLGAALSAFAAIGEIATVVITVPPEAETGEFAARQALPARFLEGREGRPRLLFVPGGKTRRASVFHALSLLESYHPRYVLIHDGARPWIDEALIRRTMKAALQYRAALPVLALVETPKEIVSAAELPEEAEIPGGLPDQGELFFVKRHLRRAHIGTAQTPQAFAFPEILYAHQKAAERERAEGFEYTDDAEIWGDFCGPVAVVPGSPENRKITFPEDLGGKY